MNQSWHHRGERMDSADACTYAPQRHLRKLQLLWIKDDGLAPRIRIAYAFSRALGARLFFSISVLHMALIGQFSYRRMMYTNVRAKKTAGFVMMLHRSKITDKLHEISDVGA